MVNLLLSILGASTSMLRPERRRFNGAVNLFFFFSLSRRSRRRSFSFLSECSPHLDLLFGRVCVGPPMRRRVLCLLACANAFPAPKATASSRRQTGAKTSLSIFQSKCPSGGGHGGVNHMGYVDGRRTTEELKHAQSDQ